jgi:GTPase SAR1 family protein
MAAVPAKYNVKILILGEANVGKTSLLVRYTMNEFSDVTNASLGGNSK